VDRNQERAFEEFVARSGDGQLQPTQVELAEAHDDRDPRAQDSAAAIELRRSAARPTSSTR
jgi:hypothetical protein